jgi:hypothetical protein
MPNMVPRTETILTGKIEEVYDLIQLNFEKEEIDNMNVKKKINITTGFDSSFLRC